jgi:hypothetical protein
MSDKNPFSQTEDSELDQIATKVNAAASRAILSLRMTTMRIDGIIEQLDDDALVLRQLLLEYRRVLRSQIDSLKQFGRE